MARLLKRTTPGFLACAVGFSVLALSTPAAPVSASELPVERTLALAPGGTFELDTDSGTVEIRGASRSDVLVTITAKKDDVTERYDFSFEEQGDRAVLRVKKRGSLGRRWFSVNDGLEFEIEVPRNTNLEVDTSGGSISARDIEGSADLSTSGGSIDLESITGVVDAETSGGSISAADLGDNADLSTSGGGISVDDVAGDLDAETSGGSIKIAGANGRIDADTSGGSVTASFTVGNSAGGSLSTSGGSVTAYVDPDAGFDLDASTSGGRVTVDLPVTVRGEISRRDVRGTINGGGSPLRLHTSGGNVTVRPR